MHVFLTPYKDSLCSGCRKPPVPWCHSTQSRKKYLQITQTFVRPWELNPHLLRLATEQVHTMHTARCNCSNILRQNEYSRLLINLNNMSERIVVTTNGQFRFFEAKVRKGVRVDTYCC